MRLSTALNLLAKLLVDYNIDYDNDPRFTLSERELFGQAERDISFYDPSRFERRLGQKHSYAAERASREASQAAGYGRNKGTNPPTSASKGTSK